MSGIDRKAAHAALDRVIDADEYGKDEEAAERLNDLIATLHPVLQYIWERSKYRDAPVPKPRQLPNGRLYWLGEEIAAALSRR